MGLFILELAAFWKLFQKAGWSGWASIIPICSTYVLVRMAGKSGCWLLLLCIPIVNIVIDFIVGHNTAKSFGKGDGFSIGMFFLPFIFYQILGLGSAEYLPLQQKSKPYGLNKPYQSGAQGY